MDADVWNRVIENTIKGMKAKEAEKRKEEENTTQAATPKYNDVLFNEALCGIGISTDNPDPKRAIVTGVGVCIFVAGVFPFVYSDRPNPSQHIKQIDQQPSIPAVQPANLNGEDTEAAPTQSPARGSQSNSPAHKKKNIKNTLPGGNGGPKRKVFTSRVYIPRGHC